MTAGVYPRQLDMCVLYETKKKAQGPPWLFAEKVERLALSLVCPLDIYKVYASHGYI